MRKYIFILTFLIPATFWAQYLLPNEEVVYSFETKNGKKMSLVKDKKGKETRIKGNYKTLEGCICNLQDTGMIEREDIGLTF